MADTLFIIPLEQLLYSSLFTLLATVTWGSLRALLLAGFLVQAITDWITTQVFGPSISQVTVLSSGLLPVFATIATFLLGISYLLSPIFKIQVVSWQKALGWLLFAVVFFQAGPGLYVELEQTRRNVASDIYALVLERSSSGVPALSAVQSGTADKPLGELVNIFGGYLPSDRYVDGLDIAAAFVYASGADVVSSPQDMPGGFREQYFPADQGAIYYLNMSAQERSDSLSLALQGVFRLLLGHTIALFGIAEQLIYLALAIAAGLLFINMAVALPLALFEPTEPLARSVLEAWLKLFIFTIIAAVFQATVIGVIVSAANTGNAALVQGAATLGTLLLGALLLRSFSAIGDSLSGMTAAASQVVGGKILSPGELGGAVAGGLASAGLAVATGGASAAVTAAAGGSLSQIAGSALAGSDTLFTTAALGSMVLPDDSPLKGMTGGFYEGAIASRMVGPAGGLLLRGGHGPGLRAHEGQAPALDTPAAMQAAAARTSVGTAMTQAIGGAPPGGYADQAQALAAVRDALQGSGSGRDSDASHYLDHHAPAIAQHVLVQSQTQPAPVSVHVTVSGQATTGGERGQATAPSAPTQAKGKQP